MSLRAQCKNRKLVFVQNLDILEKNRFLTSDVLCFAAMRVMKDLSCEDVKIKRELNEVCLNCRNYVSCDHIAQYEECEHFEEVEGEAWVITKLG